MRRTVAVVLCAFALMVSIAAPAFAARDPFRPLVSQSSAPTSSSSTSSTASSTTSQTGSTATSTTPVQPTDASPNTGFDASIWAAIALALMVIGGGLIVIERLLRPGLPAAGR